MTKVETAAQALVKKVEKTAGDDLQAAKLFQHWCQPEYDLLKLALDKMPKDSYRKSQ